MYDYKAELARDIREYLSDERIELCELSLDERSNLEDILSETSYIVGCDEGYFGDNLDQYRNAVYNNFGLLYESLYLEGKNLVVKDFAPSLDQLREWDYIIRCDLLPVVLDEMIEEGK